MHDGALALSLLGALVGFDTESSKSNLPLIIFVEEYLSSHGLTSWRLPSDCGTKSRLVASIGPSVAGGIVLSGHTDVVPVDRNDWTSDPFELTLKGGRAYGRGTTDMKGFLAVCLASVPAMLAAPLKRPIRLAFSYDEEPGCLAAPDMIERMRQVLPEVSMVVVGEPTGMKVSNAHKGVFILNVRVRGVDVHSSRPDIGVSAVRWASEMIAELYALEPGEGPIDTRPTLNVGMVHGGTANNVIAGDCTFTVGLRYLRDADLGQLSQRIRSILSEGDRRMKARNATTGVEWDEHFIPSLQPDVDTHAEEVCKRLSGTNEAITVPFATEAGQFQQVGWSTVVVGPGFIDQAHTPDEYIEIEQLYEGLRFLERVIEHQSR